MPTLAVLLFVAVVAVFVALAHREEYQQRRAGLIEDILWQKQAIELQLFHTRDTLGVLARELAAGTVGDAAFERRVQSVLTASPEIGLVARVDAAGRITDTVPPGARPAGTVLAGAARSALDDARRLARATFGGVERLDDGTPGFVLLVPVMSDAGMAGALVATHSLTGLLRHHVPWWFTQRYRLAIMDADGAEVLAKPAARVPDGGPDYSVPFDPPGRGLVLHAELYRYQSALAGKALITVVVGLSTLILWSLWTLGQHMRRVTRGEQELRAAQERFVAVLAALPDAVAVLDPVQGILLYANEAFRRQFVRTPAEGAACALLPWRTVVESRRDFDVEVQDDDGRWLQVRGLSFSWVDGRPAVLELVSDISARRRSEEHARRQEEQWQFTGRLVTMGEMASSLAHELNQPLTAIAGYSSAALNRVASGSASGPELDEVLQKIALQSQRAGKILRGIREYVRRTAPRCVACDVNAVVTEALGFADLAARRQQVRIATTLAEGLPRVMADPVMIEQVVLNLVKNAIEAVQDQPSECREVTITTAAGAAGVEVQVSDRGRGIDPAQADQLFAPFFTTKPEGMGMGLSICRTIIEFHKGRLGYAPRPGGGTVFTFTLPEVPA